MAIVGSFPHHVGIIMDGNGRWAQARGLPRLAGHQAGTQAVRRAVAAGCELGIRVLTLYTFSSENWQRPPAEVTGILQLIEAYCVNELPELQRSGVHLQHMGRREGLPGSLLRVLDYANQRTRANSLLTLNLALNYGGRAEIVDGARAVLAASREGRLCAAGLDEEALQRHLYCPDVPAADLVMRTGGEHRLSNFLLWRAAGAVFWCTPVLWPEFQREHLLAALQFYREQSGGTS